MKQKDLVMRKHQLLCRLSSLPEKIVSAHEVENLAEFVLYELCHPECFNLGKAAFFVDNPDFDCLRGVAGITADDHIHTLDKQDVWQMHEAFTKTMRDSAFNASVRAVSTPSLAKSGMPVDQEVAKIVTMLPFKAPEWRSFKTKHGNRGILIYEHQDDADNAVAEHIVSGASLLAFCPIF
jgi:hypothetical protein